MDKNLKTLAINVRNNSYSPYSKFKVGAALKLSNGKTFAGCNVENSSYGGAICAERSAVCNAVSAEGPGIKIEEIVISTDTTPPSTPCGICRQVIFEFASPTCVVHLVNLKEEVVTYPFAELFPHGFDKNSLPTK